MARDNIVPTTLLAWDILSSTLGKRNILAEPSLLLNVSNPTRLDPRGLHASDPRRGTEIPRSELHVDKSGRRKVIDTRALVWRSVALFTFGRFDRSLRGCLLRVSVEVTCRSCCHESATYLIHIYSRLLEMEFGIVSTIDKALTSIASAYRTTTSFAEPKYRSRRPNERLQRISRIVITHRTVTPLLPRDGTAAQSPGLETQLHESKPISKSHI